MDSALPLALSRRSAPASKLGGIERSVLVALGLFGLVVTLHRNDVLAKLARSVGGESSYVSVQNAFGGPSTSTPQGVRAFAAALPPLAPPESLKAKAMPPRAAEPRPETDVPVPRTPAPARAVSKNDGKADAKSEAKPAAKKKPAKGAKAKPSKKAD